MFVEKEITSPDWQGMHAASEFPLSVLAMNANPDAPEIANPAEMPLPGPTWIVPALMRALMWSASPGLGAASVRMASEVATNRTRIISFTSGKAECWRSSSSCARTRDVSNSGSSVRTLDRAAGLTIEV